MLAETLLDIIGADFYTGVPDSALKPLCDALINRYGTDGQHHIIGANEGNCAALAAGYYLAGGKTPVVYMQNSGLGNVVNPAASLLHEKVYGIPMLLVIGWRGEPDTKDEPQHILQGVITGSQLDLLDIPHEIVSRDTTEDQLRCILEQFRALHRQGRQTALIIRRGALQAVSDMCYSNRYQMRREDIIRQIVRVSGEDPVIATTGKAGRELYEIREADGSGHARDFLTVGSMGHCSSIALGIALHCPQKRVWCIDGDGAALMHMGAMAVIGAQAPENLVHVIINNGAHESVGGMPTVAERVSIPDAARAFGYAAVYEAETPEALACALNEAQQKRALTLIEVHAAIGARANLGRPTSSPADNKRTFMAHLQAE